MANKRIIQVEEKVPFQLLLPLSIQHMFAMFGASVLVPFIFGISPAIVLFMNGVGTLLFIAITKGKAPAYLGSSFAFLAPCLLYTSFASSASFLPQPGFAIYAATKSFVLSYSRALNTELRARDITVTAVCPGPVKTEFFDIAETTGTIPLYKRLAMADPKKVVRLALRDSMMGKSISVYGPLMKAFSVLCKVFPHEFLLRVMDSL